MAKKKIGQKSRCGFYYNDILKRCNLVNTKAGSELRVVLYELGRTFNYNVFLIPQGLVLRADKEIIILK